MPIDVSRKTRCSKKNDIVQKYVSRRCSTLINEFSKTLASMPFDETATKEYQEHQRLIGTVLNMNDYCEYCETRKWNTEDHFHPLVAKKFPTDACNDMWNMVRACHQCNSSKGSKTIQEWKNSKGSCNPFAHGQNEEIYQKILRFQELSDRYRYRKSFDNDDMNKIISTCVTYLQHLEEMVNALKKKTVYTKGCINPA